MIGRDEVVRLRAELQSTLGEDAVNTERLLVRLDALTGEAGLGPHAAMLMILAHLGMEEGEARRHWEAIGRHRGELSEGLGRDVGLRVALLDYFTNVNRRLVRPTLIDVELLESTLDEAAHDRLTGLATDRSFRVALQNELRRARRYVQSTSVVLFDLDDFAEVNERCGQLVADRLFREAAIALGNATRDIDIAGRPGEDELALVLPETDRNGALLVAERVRRDVEAYFERREVGGRPARLTLSAGSASYPDDAASADDLLRHAAEALYEAKAAGKNTVMAYRPERRRYLRFELEPGRFEVEVLAPPAAGGPVRNFSRSGVVFASPERIEVGETIEIRLADSGNDGDEGTTRLLRVRGRVARLEELPVPEAPDSTDPGLADDRYEIGVAFDLDWVEGTEDLLALLERARGQRTGSGG